jgi:hypothetical protein
VYAQGDGCRASDGVLYVCGEAGCQGHDPVADGEHRWMGLRDQIRESASTP